MAAKKQATILKGGLLQKNQYFAVVAEDDLADPKEIYFDDPERVETPWTPEEVISDFLEENFNHRGCSSGNCNLTEERLKKFSYAEKKTTLKVHGYRLMKLTFQEL